MNRSEVIYLVDRTYTQNEYGVMLPTETKKKVFCSKTSVTSAEWFEGGRNGLNPEYRFIVFKYDYNNEEVLEYNSVQYTIYRTYENNDLIELYVEKRKGNES